MSEDWLNIRNDTYFAWTGVCGSIYYTWVRSPVWYVVVVIRDDRWR